MNLKAKDHQRFIHIAKIQHKTRNPIENILYCLKNMQPAKNSAERERERERDGT